jgi:hypothetical protein
MKRVFYCAFIYDLLSLRAAPIVAAPIQVSGRVLDADGKPVAGARVVQGDPLPGQTSTDIATDAEGCFTITGQARENEEELGPCNQGIVGSVVILAKGRTVGGGALKKNAANDFTLQRPRIVTGVVRDDKGVAVAEVKVRVSFTYRYAGNDSNLYAPNTLAQFSGISGADGLWALQGLPQTGSVIVEVDDPTYLRTIAQFDSDSSRKSEPLVLRPPAASRDEYLIKPVSPLVASQFSVGGRRTSRRQVCS